jgi:hypothetical protein
MVRCRSFTAHEVEITSLRANFGCQKAKSVVVRLLAHGLSGVPRQTKHNRKWGCARSGDDRVCTWYRSGRHRPLRVRFQAVKIKTITNGTPLPQPTPLPPAQAGDTVQQCIDIWNADGANRAQYGIHFYLDHNIREAWAFTIANPLYPTILRCAVVFSVPPDDPYRNEFGTDGEVRKPDASGWQLMNLVPELGDPVALQQQAPQNVNASLSTDGSLRRK